MARERVRFAKDMTAPVLMFALLEDVAGPSSVLRQHDVITLLLIFLFFFALGLGVLFFLGYRFLRSNRLTIRPAARKREEWADAKRSQSRLFESPVRWIAIRSGNLLPVQAALRLHNPTPCSWEEGLARAQGHKLFISPPVGGWILVMGSELPDPGDDVDKCFRFIMDLSLKLGHVQYFSVNRVVDHHSWAHAEQGRVVRAYAWAGRTVWNQGKMTREEMELGLRCFDYGEVAHRHNFDQVDPVAANTEKVLALAARWSIDPTTVDERMVREGRGIAGKLSRTRSY
jgi:hypothetical protein